MIVHAEVYQVGYEVKVVVILWQETGADNACNM